MVANNSYFDETSNYAELWNYLEKQHIYQILNTSDYDVENDITVPLSVEQQNRLNAILNWATERVQNGLREKYVFDGVTRANCPLEVKGLIARYAQWWLENRRMRSGQATTDKLEELDKELLRMGLESSVHRLNITKQTNAMATAVNAGRTQFDRAEQFDNIIPGWERNLPAADGYGSDA